MEAFKQLVYTEGMYSGPKVSCVNCVERWSVVICPKHAFVSCWIATQYIVRVLHFSTFSFIECFLFQNKKAYLFRIYHETGISHINLFSRKKCL